MNIRDLEKIIEEKIDAMLLEFKYSVNVPTTIIFGGEIKLESPSKIKKSDIVKYLKSKGIKSGIYYDKLWFDRAKAKDPKFIAQLKIDLANQFGLNIKNVQEKIYKELDPAEELKSLKNDIGDDINTGKKIVKDIKLFRNSDDQMEFEIELINGKKIIVIKKDKWLHNYTFKFDNKFYDKSSLYKILIAMFLNSVEKFKHAVLRHDWTYEMSDDFGYWASGDANIRRMRAAYKDMTESEKQEMYKFYNSNAPKTKELNFKFSTFSEFNKFMSK